MDNRKLMEAAEAVVRINARLKEEGWEMLRFVPKTNPYNGCALLKLEIMRISENPDTLKPQEPARAETELAEAH